MWHAPNSHIPFNLYILHSNSLLLQFYPLHSRGSSHGGSRITRKANGAPEIQKMTVESNAIFTEMERKSGKQLRMYVTVVSLTIKC